ncbi:amidase family protein [Nocardia wallacei]|uniref:amidase family protein n=1 Tax=Nocardia wallacei TaxID=480035 RepID=UPI00245871DA|nr:amidase family protein [Nocardia wallacei]
MDDFSPTPVVLARELYEQAVELLPAPVRWLVEMVVFGGDLPRADVSRMRWMAARLREKAASLNEYAEEARSLGVEQDTVGVLGDKVREMLRLHDKGAVRLHDEALILADQADGAANEAEKTLCVMFAFGVQLVWQIYRTLAVAAAAGPAGQVAAASTVESMLVKGRAEAEMMRTGLKQGFAWHAANAVARVTGLGPLQLAVVVGKSAVFPAAVDGGVQLLQWAQGRREMSLIGANGENPNGFDLASIAAMGAGGAGGAVGGAVAGQVASKVFPRVESSRWLLGLVHGTAGAVAGLGAAALVTGWPQDFDQMLAELLNGAAGGAMAAHGSVRARSDAVASAVIDGSGRFRPPDVSVGGRAENTGRGVGPGARGHLMADASSGGNGRSAAGLAVGFDTSGQPEGIEPRGATGHYELSESTVQSGVREAIASNVVRSGVHENRAAVAESGSAGAASSVVDSREAKLRAELADRVAVDDQRVVDARKQLDRALAAVEEGRTALESEIAGRDVAAARAAHDAAVSEAVEERFEARKAEEEAAIAAADEQRLRVEAETGERMRAGREALAAARAQWSESRDAHEAAVTVYEASVRGHVEESIGSVQERVDVAGAALARREQEYRDYIRSAEPEAAHLAGLQRGVDRARDRLRGAMAEREALLRALPGEHATELKAAETGGNEVVSRWSRRAFRSEVAVREQYWRRALAEHDEVAKAKLRAAEGELQRCTQTYRTARDSLMSDGVRAIDERFRAAAEAGRADIAAYEAGVADRDAAFRAASDKRLRAMMATDELATEYYEEMLYEGDASDSVAVPASPDALLKGITEGTRAERYLAMRKWAELTTGKDMRVTQRIAWGLELADMKTGEGKTLLTTVKTIDDAIQHGVAYVWTSSDSLVLETIASVEQVTRSEHGDLPVDTYRLAEMSQDGDFPEAAPGRGQMFVGTPENAEFLVLRRGKAFLDRLREGGASDEEITGLRERLFPRLKEHRLPLDAIKEALDEAAEQHGLDAEFEPLPGGRGAKVHTIDEMDTVVDGREAVLSPGASGNEDPEVVARLEEVWQRFKAAQRLPGGLTAADFGRPDGTRGFWRATLSPEAIAKLNRVPGKEVTAADAEMYTSAALAEWARVRNSDYIEGRGDIDPHGAEPVGGETVGSDSVQGPGDATSGSGGKVLLIASDTNDQLQANREEGTETRTQGLVGQFMDLKEGVPVRANLPEEALYISVDQLIGSSYLGRPTGYSGTLKIVEAELYDRYGIAGVPENPPYYVSQLERHYPLNDEARHHKLAQMGRDVVGELRLTPVFDENGVLVGVEQHGRPQLNEHMDNRNIRGDDVREDENGNRIRLHGWRDKFDHEKGLVDWVDQITHDHVQALSRAYPLLDACERAGAPAGEVAALRQRIAQAPPVEVIRSMLDAAAAHYGVEVRFDSVDGLPVADGIGLEYLVLDARTSDEHGTGEAAKRWANDRIKNAWGAPGTVAFVNKEYLRGTDWEPTPESIALGGTLARMDGGPSRGQRAFEQGVGRASRGGTSTDRAAGGTPGTFMQYLSPEDFHGTVANHGVTEQVVMFTDAVTAQRAAAAEHAVHNTADSRAALDRADRAVAAAERVLREHAAPAQMRAVEHHLLATGRTQHAHTPPAAAAAPHAVAPDQANASPYAVVPGQTNDSPHVVAPGRTNAFAQAVAPGQDAALVPVMDGGFAPEPVRSALPAAGSHSANSFVGPQHPAERFARLAGWLRIPAAIPGAIAAPLDDEDDDLPDRSQPDTSAAVQALNRLHTGLPPAATETLNQHLDHPAPAAVVHDPTLSDKQALHQLEDRRDRLSGELGLRPGQVAGAEGIRLVGDMMERARQELSEALATLPRPPAEVDVGIARAVIADAVAHLAQTTSTDTEAPAQPMVEAASKYLALTALLDLVVSVHQRTPNGCVNNAVTMMRVLYPDNQHSYRMPEHTPLAGHGSAEVQFASGGGDFATFDSLDTAAESLANRPGGASWVVYNWVDTDGGKVGKVRSHLVLLHNRSDRQDKPDLVVLDINAGNIRSATRPEDLSGPKALLKRSVRFEEWKKKQGRHIERLSEKDSRVWAIEFDSGGNVLERDSEPRNPAASLPLANVVSLASRRNHVPPQVQLDELRPTGHRPSDSQPHIDDVPTSATELWPETGDVLSEQRFQQFLGMYATDITIGTLSDRIARIAREEGVDPATFSDPSRWSEVSDELRRALERRELFLRRSAELHSLASEAKRALLDFFRYRSEIAGRRDHAAAEYRRLSGLLDAKLAEHLPGQVYVQPRDIENYCAAAALMDIRDITGNPDIRLLHRDVSPTGTPLFEVAAASGAHPVAYENHSQLAEQLLESGDGATALVFDKYGDEAGHFYVMTNIGNEIAVSDWNGSMLHAFPPQHRRHVAAVHGFIFRRGSEGASGRSLHPMDEATREELVELSNRYARLVREENEFDELRRTLETMDSDAPHRARDLAEAGERLRALPGDRRQIGLVARAKIFDRQFVTVHPDHIGIIPDASLDNAYLMTVPYEKLLPTSDLLPNLFRVMKPGGTATIRVEEPMFRLDTRPREVARHLANAGFTGVAFHHNGKPFMLSAIPTETDGDYEIRVVKPAAAVDRKPRSSIGARPPDEQYNRSAGPDDIPDGMRIHPMPGRPGVTIELISFDDGSRILRETYDNTDEAVAEWTNTWIGRYMGAPIAEVLWQEPQYHVLYREHRSLHRGTADPRVADMLGLFHAITGQASPLAAVFVRRVGRRRQWQDHHLRRQDIIDAGRRVREFWDYLFQTPYPEAVRWTMRETHMNATIALGEIAAHAEHPQLMAGLDLETQAKVRLVETFKSRHPYLEVTGFDSPYISEQVAEVILGRLDELLDRYRYAPGYQKLRTNIRALRIDLLSPQTRGLMSPRYDERTDTVSGADLTFNLLIAAEQDAEKTYAYVAAHEFAHAIDQATGFELSQHIPAVLREAHTKLERLGLDESYEEWLGPLPLAHPVPGKEAEAAEETMAIGFAHAEINFDDPVVGSANWVIHEYVTKLRQPDIGPEFRIDPRLRITGPTGGIGNRPPQDPHEGPEEQSPAASRLTESPEMSAAEALHARLAEEVRYRAGLQGLRASVAGETRPSDMQQLRDASVRGLSELLGREILQDVARRVSDPDYDTEFSREREMVQAEIIRLIGQEPEGYRRVERVLEPLLRRLRALDLDEWRELGRRMEAGAFRWLGGWILRGILLQHPMRQDLPEVVARLDLSQAAQHGDLLAMIGTAAADPVTAVASGGDELAEWRLLGERAGTGSPVRELVAAVSAYLDHGRITDLTHELLSANRAVHAAYRRDQQRRLGNMSSETQNIQAETGQIVTESAAAPEEIRDLLDELARVEKLRDQWAESWVSLRDLGTRRERATGLPSIRAEFERLTAALRWEIMRQGTHFAEADPNPGRVERVIAELAGRASSGATDEGMLERLENAKRWRRLYFLLRYADRYEQLLTEVDTRLGEIRRVRDQLTTDWAPDSWQPVPGWVPAGAPREFTPLPQAAARARDWGRRIAAAAERKRRFSADTLARASRLGIDDAETLSPRELAEVVDDRAAGYDDLSRALGELSHASSALAEVQAEAFEIENGSVDLESRMVLDDFARVAERSLRLEAATDLAEEVIRSEVIDRGGRRLAPGVGVLEIDGTAPKILVAGPVSRVEHLLERIDSADFENLIRRGVQLVGFHVVVDEQGRVFVHEVVPEPAATPASGPEPTGDEHSRRPAHETFAERLEVWRTERRLGTRVSATARDEHAWRSAHDAITDRLDSWLSAGGIGTRLTPCVAFLPDSSGDGGVVVVAAPLGGHDVALAELATANPRFAGVGERPEFDCRYLAVLPGIEGPIVAEISAAVARNPDGAALPPGVAASHRAASAVETEGILLGEYLRYRRLGLVRVGFRDWLAQLGEMCFGDEGLKRDGTVQAFAAAAAEAQPTVDEDRPDPTAVLIRVAGRSFPLPDQSDPPSGTAVGSVSLVGTVDIGGVTAEVELFDDGGVWRVAPPRGDGQPGDVLSRWFERRSDTDPDRLLDRLAHLLNDGDAALTTVDAGVAAAEVDSRSRTPHVWRLRGFAIGSPVEISLTRDRRGWRSTVTSGPNSEILNLTGAKSLNRMAQELTAMLRISNNESEAGGSRPSQITLSPDEIREYHELVRQADAAAGRSRACAEELDTLAGRLGMASPEVLEMADPAARTAVLASLRGAVARDRAALAAEIGVDPSELESIPIIDAEHDLWRNRIEAREADIDTLARLLAHREQLAAAVSRARSDRDAALTRPVVAAELERSDRSRQLGPGIVFHPNLAGRHGLLVVIAPPNGHAAALTALALEHREFADASYRLGLRIHYLRVDPQPDGRIAIEQIEPQAAGVPIDRRNEARLHLLHQYLVFRKAGVLTAGFREWLRQLGAGAFTKWPESARVGKGLTRSTAVVSEPLVTPLELIEMGRRTVRADPALDPRHPAHVLHRLHTHRAAPLPLSERQRGDPSAQTDPNPSAHLETHPITLDVMADYVVLERRGRTWHLATDTGQAFSDLLAVHFPDLTGKTPRELIEQLENLVRAPPRVYDDSAPSGLPRTGLLTAFDSARLGPGTPRITVPEDRAAEVPQRGGTGTEAARWAGANWHRGGYSDAAELVEQVRRSRGTVVGVVDLGTAAPAFTVRMDGDVITVEEQIFRLGPRGVAVPEVRTVRGDEAVDAWAAHLMRVSGPEATFHGLAWKSDGTPENPLLPGRKPSGVPGREIPLRLIGGRRDLPEEIGHRPPEDPADGARRDDPIGEYNTRGTQVRSGPRPLDDEEVPASAATAVGRVAGPLRSTHFPLPERVIRANAPDDIAALQVFSLWQADTANRAWGKINARWDPAASGAVHRRALSQLYFWISHQRYLRQVWAVERDPSIVGSYGQGHPENFAARLDDAAGNIDQFGNVYGLREGTHIDPETGRRQLGHETPAYLQAQEIGKLIRDRLIAKGSGSDELQNFVDLPDGRRVAGNILSYFGLVRFAIESARFDDRKTIFAAAIAELSSILENRSPYPSITALRRFAGVAYLLFQAPLTPRGSDSTTRMFLAATATSAFGRPIRLPQDVDVQAMARRQSDFVEWFTETLRRDIGSEPVDRSTGQDPAARAVTASPGTFGAHSNDGASPTGPIGNRPPDDAEPLPVDLERADIATLQRVLSAGHVTSADLVVAYLRRIEKVDRDGPRLNSVLAINPDAMRDAESRDAERLAGYVRGPLHGVPIMVKDNIDVSGMPTTGGASAMRDSFPADDAFLVKRLRRAGAVILGKTNLTEFANFTTDDMPPGYSALGGQVVNPYNRSASPAGSSSGSAVSVAAGLAAGSVGTDTFGSIVSPSVWNSLVGVRPTVGVVSRTGLLPISSTQDTAGPMARSVYDAAVLLTAMAGRDPEDPASTNRDEYIDRFLRANRFLVPPVSRPADGIDYVAGLSIDALRGTRIGVVATYDTGSMRTAFTNAQAVLRDQGATLVEVGHLVGPQTPSVLMHEFKRDLNAYLGRLPADAPMKTLDDILRFNLEHADSGTLAFGQRLLEASAAVDLRDSRVDSVYRSDRGLGIVRTRKLLSSTLTDTRLDALVFIADTGFLLAARALYPVVAVPIGYDPATGRPFGMTLVGEAFSEASLLAYAYAYEQAAQVWRPPSEMNPDLYRPAGPTTSPQRASSAAVDDKGSDRSQASVSDASSDTRTLSTALENFNKCLEQVQSQTGREFDLLQIDNLTRPENIPHAAQRATSGEFHALGSWDLRERELLLRRPGTSYLIMRGSRTMVLSHSKENQGRLEFFDPVDGRPQVYEYGMRPFQIPLPLIPKLGVLYDHNGVVQQLPGSPILPTFGEYSQATVRRQSDLGEWFTEARLAHGDSGANMSAQSKNAAVEFEVPSRQPAESFTDFRARMASEMYRRLHENPGAVTDIREWFKAAIYSAWLVGRSHSDARDVARYEAEMSWHMIFNAYFTDIALREAYDLLETRLSRDDSVSAVARELNAKYEIPRQSFKVHKVAVFPQLAEFADTMLIILNAGVQAVWRECQPGGSLESLMGEHINVQNLDSQILERKYRQFSNEMSTVSTRLPSYDEFVPLITLGGISRIRRGVVDLVNTASDIVAAFHFAEYELPGGAKRDIFERSIAELSKLALRSRKGVQIAQSGFVNALENATVINAEVLEPLARRALRLGPDEGLTTLLSPTPTPPPAKCPAPHFRDTAGATSAEIALQIAGVIASATIWPEPAGDPRLGGGSRSDKHKKTGSLPTPWTPVDKHPRSGELRPEYDAADVDDEQCD